MVLVFGSHPKKQAAQRFMVSAMLGRNDHEVGRLGRERAIIGIIRDQAHGGGIAIRQGHGVVDHNVELGSKIKDTSTRWEVWAGDKFDKQYLEQAGDRSHKDTHKLLKQASTKAQDADLKNYASKTLAVVESHQQMAKETSKNVESSSHGKSGASSTGAGTSGGKGSSGTNQ